MTALNLPQSFETAASLPVRRSLFARLFSPRAVAHRTFGTLKPWRNGNYLRTRAEFGPEKRKIWLVIRANPAGPTHLQETLYLQVQKHYHNLTPHLLAALFSEYQKVRRLWPAIPWPKVAKPADLLSVIPLSALWLEEGPGHPFVLSFQSELDSDHEFHAFYREGKLQNVAFEH